MTTYSAFVVQTYYSGSVAEKLRRARELYLRHGSRLAISPPLREELARLQRHTLALDGHMESMGMGRLCSLCAARPGGGCCSAYMADNTDTPLLLINLLLDVKVQPRETIDENCCFLGAHGCFFLVKPIFCLNYNCTTILASAEAASLEELYRLAGGVLSQQTRVENLLLETFRATPQ